jgi:hypothetical protein
MADTKKHLETLACFIREHRSNERHFETLHEKLLEEQRALQNSNEAPDTYAETLHEANEKHAAAYKQNKEKNISTWAEFENFVSHFEKAVTEAKHG